MEDVGRPAFGTLLRQLRLRADLSQEALAERARMSPVTVGALERGVRRAPYRDTVALLAEALELDAGEREALESAAVRPQRPRRTAEDSAPTNNLPVYLTHFVGREPELAQLGAVLAAHRLVTIVGAGGIGKTRTALHVAAAAATTAAREAGAGDAQPLEGLWFVELAPLTDPALVAGSIASALGVAEQSDRAVLDTLLQFLRSRTVLLILDNCEHVVDEAARVAEALLRACPGVRLLATSREPLRAQGEHVYRLPPLAVPPKRATLDADEALRYGAISLFTERATAADANFRLGDESVAAVSEICRRLDGIALAIELAAARVNVLEPRRLAALLDERFRVLTAGSRTALPRQQTMWALIDWSYDLLSEREQQLFRRISVFAGGWTLEAALDVCACDGSEELLWALVDKSLVVAEPGDEEERYRFLESTREYARRRLEQSGEADAFAERHARWTLAFAERAKALLETMPDRAWFGLIDAELDNVRAALDWSLRRGHAPALGAALAAALGEYWPPRQRREGRMWLEAARTAVDAAREPALAASVALGLAATLPLSVERAERAAEIVAAFRRVGDERELVRALRLYGDALIFSGDLDASEAALGEGIALARRIGERRRLVVLLDALGAVCRLRGDYTSARVHQQEALEVSLARDGAASRYHAQALANLGELEFVLGDVERAIELATQSRAIFAALGDADHAANVLLNLTAYSLAADRFDTASEYVRRTLVEVNGLQQPFTVAAALEHAAAIAGLSGDCERAATLLGFADARLRALKLHRQPTERAGYERLQAVLTERFTAAELERRLAVGAALTEAAAIELATHASEAANPPLGGRGGVPR
jgi:predicted ATPase/transcriptional regulator with XRE-family HTH domain